MSVEIRAAIADQLGLFARLVDAKDWAGIGRVFADDVVFDYGGGREGVGLAALRATFRRYLDCCGASQHLLGSIVMDFADTGMPVSSSYVQARHIGLGLLAGECFDTSGEYRDSWRQDGGAWRIVRRIADFTVFVGNPAVIDFDSQPAS